SWRPWVNMSFRSVLLSLGGAALIAGGVAFGCSSKSCHALGCPVAFTLRAHLDGQPPWDVSFCRDSSCSSCMVDDPPDAGGSTTGCTDVTLFQRESESSPA